MVTSKYQTLQEYIGKTPKRFKMNSVCMYCVYNIGRKTFFE